MANNQKYYHNDYKKLMGVDESRTASEKLLDRAIGGFKRQPVEQKQEKVPQKKVKQQNKNLSHSEILAKILKNLQGNLNASKLLKPLAILKKCLNDPGFVNNSEVNTLQQWTRLVAKMLQIQQKAVGNYSQINLMSEQLLQIFILLQKLIKKIEEDQVNEVKVEQTIKIQQNQIEVKKTINQNAVLYRKKCNLLVLYCKMYTDDSFVFNKTLVEFKKTFFEYFQAKVSSTELQPGNKQFFKFLQNMLMKLFKLPYTKHEWVKSSLSQFYRQFNINYKILLQEELCENYLKSYNQFLNHKLSRGAGEQVNIIAHSGKGGKITQIQTVSDGLDKWTSRQ